MLGALEQGISLGFVVWDVLVNLICSLDFWGALEQGISLGFVVWDVLVNLTCSLDAGGFGP